MKTYTKNKALYSLLLIGILLNIQPAFSYTFNGYEVHDLINVNLADEIKSWTVSRAINSQALSTSISGVNFLGGPNVLGTATTSSGDSFSRTYKTLPKHNLITFQFTLSVCGAWSDDIIKASFDGVAVNNLQFNQKNFVAGVCGSAAGLSDIIVSGRIAHNMNTVTFKLASAITKPSSQVSFGIRDFSFICATVATTAVKTDVCCSSSTSSALAWNQCPCTPGSYATTTALTGSTTKCVAGSPLCDTCFGASAAECYSCKMGTYFDGKNCVACDSTCAACTGAGPSKCTVLKQTCIEDCNGNCVASCPAPLTLDATSKLCSSKCSLDQWIYPDGSCQPSCSGDLVQVAIGCYKLCTSPCKVGFLTCEGNCQTSCIPPAQIRETNGIGYCDWPCPQGEYYWQESKLTPCTGDCPLPWECGTDSKTGIPICQPKCDPDSKLYVWVAEENKCDCECPSGYSVQKVKGLYTCLPICSSDEVFWAEGGEGQTCLNKCPDGWATKTDPYGNQYCDRICCAGPDEIFFNGQCVCECPQGWQTLMINKVPMCVPLCDCGQYWWEEGCVGGVGSCMDKCPDAWVEGKDCNGLDICQRQCCDGDKDVWFKEEGQCVCDCPDGWVKAKINDAWMCVEACECDEFWWGSEYKASCVDKCPDGWKCDKGCADVDICSPQCCADAPENIWFGAKGECVCECPPGWLANDVNGVPQCVHACECGDVWWQECPSAGVCLDKCPEGWQCIEGCEGVDLCAAQCPCDSEDNIWFPAKQACVCECPPAWISSTVNSVLQCVPACGCEEYWWCEGGDNGACVCECPDGWQCDTGCEGAKICSPKCKPTDKENIWFSEKGECVCECPAGWVPQEVNGGLQCVKACKQGEFWWQECNGEGACVCECPEGWKCDKGCEDVDICSPQCCVDAPENIWFGAKGECVCECPPAWTSEKINDVWQCVPTCEKDLYWWCEGGDTGACVCECPVGWKCDTGCEGIPICSPICNPTDTEKIYFPEINQCVCECPDGFVAQEINGGLQCVEVCPKGEFWWQGCDGKESCVCDCPEGWKCDKGCAGVDICTPQCPADAPENVWLGPENTCVCECPPGYAKDLVNDVWQCVPVCECDQIWWCEGGANGACVDKCPVGWKCAPGCGDIEICIPDCDCTSPENIWFDAKGQCVCECPPGWVKAEVNSVPQCVLSCECGDYWWQECGSEGACVEKCPDGWKCDKGCENVDICTPQCCADAPEKIWFGAQGACVCECCDGWVAQEVNGVLQCVEVCQCDQIWWSDGAVGGACVDKCPDGWKCDKGCEGIDICVPLCPCDSIDNIWFADKNECVCECPAGWVKAEINNVAQCVHACQCGEYWWQDCGNEGACVCDCPQGWKTDKGCEYVDLCSPQCDFNAPENTWLASEQKCVCQCPDGYYKSEVNGVWQCVPICEPGFYWWSEGNACVCECPLGWSWGSGCGNIDICVPVCDLTCDEKNFFKLKDECIPFCPPGTEPSIVNFVPICMTICPEGELWWCEGADTGACVCECPLGWVAGEGPGGIPICNRQCDADSVDNVWFNEKGICTCECPQGWTVDTINDALVCSHLCPDNELWWQAGGVDGACVCECPENWVPGTGCDGVGICIPQCDQTSTKSILLNGDCACECPCGWISVKVNDLPVCKTLCPQGQYWWELAAECVCQCPDGYKCDKDPYGADVCVPQCDLSTPEIYWSPADGKCVCDCPSGTSINTVNKVLTCVSYCNEIF